MLRLIQEPDISFNERDIEELKNYFKEDINSNRRLEQITTIEELLNVLEDRDVLTDDILKKCEPKFVNFVKTRRNSHADFRKLVIPENVRKLVSEYFTDDWGLLGEHLQLKEDQFKLCENVQDVLSCYTENCEGISQQEMIYWLNRGLEKCGMLNLKNTIIELMKQNSS